jgi:4-aminobutyrate aminotransferase-like enzyme/Ser/Thr protein kinase RdoA (MazF antagonist)
MSVDVTLAEKLARKYFGIEAKARKLVGELDYNFKLDTVDGPLLLKISQPGANEEFQDFQLKLLEHLALASNDIEIPELIKHTKIELDSNSDNKDGQQLIRLLSWIPGGLWSSINPKNDNLRYQLGQQVGLLSCAFKRFDHPQAHRPFDWDLAQANWTKDHHHLFDKLESEIITYFHSLYDEIQSNYSQLRKSVIHNDANDNNIIVSENSLSPKVISVIDYGDAIYSQTINELAVTLSYAIMNVPDPLQAALPIIKGYHSHFPLQEVELSMLYTLIGIRLIISVTKSSINKDKNPNNEYLQISEKPAWELLKKWYVLNEQLVYYSFREACDFNPHPAEKKFVEWASSKDISLSTLFPTISTKEIESIDLSIGSNWLGHTTEFNNNQFLSHRLDELRQGNRRILVAGGYLEPRPVYSTEAYEKEGNEGPEYRTVHLGIDFWLPPLTSVHSLIDGEVVSVYNNDKNKDYGPTVILKHTLPSHDTFYSLYGHLSASSLEILNSGNQIKEGELIGYIGDKHENGNWAPHLHFQLMLDLLGNKTDFPGVSFPNESSLWKSLCPDPNLLFKRKELSVFKSTDDSPLIKFRSKHLGKGMSLSYSTPLKIMRGDGVYLLDATGRRYLDTVNNVAHIGHEHPRVVAVGQRQMAILNTNTRYLHPTINSFAENLLSTFPEGLSVVHFVNSGSEANELAIRMAKTCTEAEDFIAVENGYHGNTNATIDISSYKFNSKGGKGAPPSTHIVPLPDTYRGIYQGESQGCAYATHIQDQINNIHAQDKKVAGFICESIISCGGQIELPEGYLKSAYNMVRKAGGLCIADEVQVGIGRVGSHFWAFQIQDVVPDIVTIGKPLGNGHPVAAVICTREVADVFANGMEYFNTFGGNPVSCAIGKEVLTIVKEEQLQENAMTVGNYLKEVLKSLQTDCPIIGDVRGQGLFLGIELNKSDKTPLPLQTEYLINRMRTLGILMSSDGPDKNVIKIKPSMIFSKSNADELIDRLRTILSEDAMKLS